MELSFDSFKLISVTLDDQEIVLDDKVVGKFATLFRTDFPKRHDLDGNYVGLDAKNKKMFAIDNNSIMVRLNKTDDFDDVANFSSDVLNSFCEILEITESEVNINVVALYKVENIENVHPISVEKLHPVSIKKDSIPGVISTVGVRIMSDDSDFEYDFRIEPSFVDESCFIASLVMSTKMEVNLSENMISSLIKDTRHLLDGTIRKIAYGW